MLTLASKNLVALQAGFMVKQNAVNHGTAGEQRTKIRITRKSVNTPGLQR
jgi:hypothetical protein